MRPGQVFVVYRSAALSLAKSNMRRRQAKNSTAEDDQRICTKVNCLKCCKKSTAFLFSRVGLFLVMMGYVAFGGILFQLLEAGNEAKMRSNMAEELNKTLNKLWNVTMMANSIPEEYKRGNFSRWATPELAAFEDTVKVKVQEGFDGRTVDSDHDWNYFGAVLYAVTLVSTIGYGHITTKTMQGKIATILYSAFGVPLMMLFVANIGSTMAKMFSFVFTRITMIFCCRLSSKKKRTLKYRQKLLEKANQAQYIVDEKPSTTVYTQEVKSNLKPAFEEKPHLSPPTTSTAPSKPTFPSTTSSTTDISADLRQLPADIRLNMLTGITNQNKPRSLASSANSVAGKPKDALVRINELIRQNSVQDIDHSNDHEDEDTRRQSIDVNQIQYYINETNKLTNSLDNSTQEKPSETSEKDESNMKQVVIADEITNVPETDTKKKSKKADKKNLKRSKSESTHNRKSPTKPVSDSSSTKDAESANTANKPPRRGFFSRKNNKLKKQTTTDDGTSENLLQQQQQTTTTDEVHHAGAKLSRKSQSFNESSTRVLPPPPNYEQSTTSDITPLPPTVTWKNEHEFYPTVDLHGDQLDDDDEDFDDDEESVPLLVTVFVIPLYLTLGAILFTIWEEWSFLNSFYFCFITLTTIGFGDFVPGSSLKVEAEKGKLISAAVYILFGLVLIAMCVNLMKEQLSQKVKRVASKLGRF
ncbi:unnamed protein product [Adineta ricciae]|uniref:Potassium channel domain-containing protein n=1 Tax=Adineta ricciae TaxID=249248 RepID=A0A814U460_ADIRI|nr:unnamed protein product [Adineta ricciae]